MQRHTSHARIGKARRALGLVALCAAWLAAPALGAEPSAEEKLWLRKCVDGLKSKSDRVRAGAESAIGALGLDAIPALVPMLGALDPKDDSDWAAAARALLAMGANSAATALESQRATWPKTVESRLSALVLDLRSGRVRGRADAAGAGGADREDPAVGAKVDAILEGRRGARTFSDDEPAVRQLIALGRPAIESLLRWFRNHADGEGDFAAVACAAAALRGLANESDIPRLGQALRLGASEVARALGKFRGPATRDALLDAVGAGVMSHDVLTALEPFSADEPTHRALIEWLRNYSGADEFSNRSGPVALFLARAGVTEALPDVLRCLGSSTRRRGQLAEAAATLGAKEGLEALVAVLRPSPDGDPFDAWDRREAGEALNRLTGRDWYHASPRARDGDVEDNAAEAAERYRAWWDAAHERLKFDPARRVWTEG